MQTVFPRHYVALKTLLFLVIFIATGYGCRTVEVKTDNKILTIMVPPFKNLKKMSDYDYIAVGVADEMARKLSYSNRFDVIDTSLLLKKIELRQLIGGADDESRLVEQMLALKAGYAIRGSYNYIVNQDLIMLNVKMVRLSDNKQMAEVSEKGELKFWNALRAMLTIKLANKLDIPLNKKEIAMLKDVETKDFNAFRDNYLGQLYYYKTLDVRIQKKQKEIKKYRELSIQHYSKAITADLSYRSARRNYARSFDFAGLVSTKEEKRQRVQGRLNEMSIFGLKKRHEAKQNIIQWIDRNNELILSMINGLPVEYYLEVQGHSDSSESSESSIINAKNVYNKLLGIGIFKEKLKFRGYGSNKRIPWVEPNNESNNRITFAIKSIIN